MTILPAVVALIAAIATGCASMGRPEGGPRDTMPPVFVSGSPAPGALNVTTNKIRLRFNENIDLKNVQQTVIVSPAQKRQPLISSVGPWINVELRDTLRDSMTYTIDFGDAITDLNEGNPLDGFAYAFSTGPVIDTLSVSGMVFEARTLEPAQGMLVGVYNTHEPDSAIATMPFERVTRTNQLGQFTIRNLAPGSYRIYALNDMNSDYHWDRSEDVAFLGEAITPVAETSVVTDSLKAADGTDSIVTSTTVTYLPNDILLTWFNENYKPAYMTKYERNSESRMTLLFNAPTDSAPELRIVASDGPLAALNGKPSSEWAAIDMSAGRDSLDIWITDSAVIRTDSLLISARYLMTDTTDRLVWATDTVKMFLRNSGKKKKNSDRNDEPKAADEAT
ncbi:MAG: Ig-like domain-containing protein, partial [Paramuribaculum sp.]